MLSQALWCCLFSAIAITPAAPTTVYSLHGSGTTNPSKLFWKVMDVMEERAKVPMFMTYRAVGSSTGMTEFVGEDNGFQAYNHFGSGDVPLAQAKYDALTGSGAEMVHVPFVLGAISIFHSVPNSPTGGVKLTACLLSKIFQRRITTWDHEEIKRENPDLVVPPGQNIVVVHRVKGSSSTAGTTQYLHTANEDATDLDCHWDLSTATTVDWPEGTVGKQGSDGVADYILSTEYAIGYLDSGHGVARGLQEIELQNKNGRYLKSVDADLGAAATTGALPADASSSWAEVNLYNREGDLVWPITMMSYFYLRKDVTELGASGTLLKAFVEYVLSEEGQELVKEFGFEPVSSDFLAYNNATLQSVTAADSPVWEFEESDDTRAGEGAGEFVLSGKRKAYAEYERSIMQTDIEALQALVASLEQRLEEHDHEDHEDDHEHENDNDDEDDHHHGDRAIAVVASLVALLGALLGAFNMYKIQQIIKTVSGSPAAGCLAPVNECIDPKGGQNPHLKIEEQL